jgi:hypothetical protein
LTIELVAARRQRAGAGAFTSGDVLILAGAALVLAGSRLPFYELSAGGISLEWSAWSNAWSLYPVALLGVAYGLTPLLLMVLARTGRPWTRRRAGIALLLSGASLVTVLAYWLRDVRIGPLELETGIGAWAMFLGATALLGGSWLHYDRAPIEPRPAPAPAAGFGREHVAVVAGAVLVVIGSFLAVFRLPRVSGGQLDVSAWSSNFSPPLFGLPVLWAAALVALVILGAWRGRPTEVLHVPRADVEAGLGVVALVTMAGFLVGSPAYRAFGITPEIERGPGFWCMFVGTALTALGAVAIAQRAKSL